VEYLYPDRKIYWPDGSEIPSELRDMLLGGLGQGFEIEHGEFAWNSDSSLSMTFRISVEQPSGKREIWEITFSYPAGEATAVHPDATPEERDWFTMMVRTHVAEWWGGGPTIVTAARQAKLHLLPRVPPRGSFATR
jgi:hypothetical protein